MSIDVEYEKKTDKHYVHILYILYYHLVHNKIKVTRRRAQPLPAELQPLLKMVRANTNAQHAQQGQHHNHQEMFSRTKSSIDISHSGRSPSKPVHSAPHEAIAPIEEMMRGYGAINQQEQQQNYDQQNNFRDEEQGQKSNK